MTELRPEVRAFAELMEAKLRANDHKPGWKQDDPYALFRRLCEEVGELRAALKKPFAVAGETADIANFCMMIADVCGWLIIEEQPARPLGTCPRCGSPLDNLSPGISVAAGGVSVCTTCLRPGEVEIARARGIST